MELAKMPNPRCPMCGADTLRWDDNGECCVVACWSNTCLGPGERFEVEIPNDKILELAISLWEGKK